MEDSEEYFNDIGKRYFLDKKIQELKEILTVTENPELREKLLTDLKLLEKGELR